MAVRLDDARRENKFGIKEMILRSEWDMVQNHITDRLNSSGQSTNGSMDLRSRE